MKSFNTILKRASERKGGDDSLFGMLPTSVSQQELAERDDRFYLSMMTRRIFQAGFVWKVVDAKWGGFEEVFLGFNIEDLMAVSTEEWEEKARDVRIIRHLQKVFALRHNVFYMNEVSAQYGSYGVFLAEWPEDDLIGLYGHLKKTGKRLGGMTGPYFLASVGKDCFLLTRDVVLCLQDYGLDISDNPTSKRDLQRVQQVFTDFHAETDLSYRQLSAIMAFSIGENRI